MNFIVKYFQFLRIFICCFFILNYSLVAAAVSPYIPDIKKVIDRSGLDNITRNHQIPLTLLPGQVFYAKNNADVAEYPDGIHHFLLSGSQDQRYLFNSIKMLQGKKALLYIIINDDVKKATFALPEIDTVIEGNKLDNYTFFLGNSTTPNQANYYFFANTSDKKSKIRLKARGQVYAQRPHIFSLLDGSSTKHIIPLEHADFFFNHTINQAVIPAHKNVIKEALRSADQHPRPARPHQIRQIVEYLIAHYQGHKYFSVEASTGSGKTNTMLRLTELLRPKKVLIITPRLNLVTQIKSEARLYYPHLNIADETGENPTFKDLMSSHSTSDIVVATLQGFQRNYREPAILHPFDIIIFDEAHNLLSEERAKMVDFLKGLDNQRLQLLFFTATPERLFEHKKSKLKSVRELSDEAKLESPHITPLPVFKAIDAEVNVPFQVVHLTNLIAAHNRWDVQGEFVEDLVSKNITDDRFHQVVLDFYLHGTIEKSDGTSIPVFGKKSLVFGPGIAHAEALAQFLNTNFDTYINDDQREIITQAVMAYRRAVHQHFNDPVLAQAFLKKYPFKFADTIHSGNKTTTIKSDESDNRILRNKLGGSLLSCGAVKLMEGYDNPQIEIAFLMGASRRSNTTMLQQLGRILRPDPNNPAKIALPVQFIWDDRQLLLSSTDVLGVMSYGLKETIKVVVPKHVPNTIDYRIATTLSMQGSIKKSASKRKASKLEKDSTKKPRVEGSLDESPKVVLLEKLHALFKRMEAKSKLLFQFSITHHQEPHESSELPASSSSSAMDVDTVRKNKTPTSTRAIAHEDDEEDDDIEEEIIRDTTNAISQLDRLLRPQNSSSQSSSSSTKKTPSKPLEQDEADLNVLKKLLKRARRILKRGEQFFTSSQMHHQSSDFAALVGEWTSLASSIKPMIDEYEQIEEALDPLYESIQKAAGQFEGTPDEVFDRILMRKFFREKLWQSYIQTMSEKGITIAGSQADSTFAKLLKAIIKKSLLEGDDPQLWLGIDQKGKYLLEIYHDLPILVAYLKSLYELFNLSMPIITPPAPKPALKIVAPIPAPKVAPPHPSLPKALPANTNIPELVQVAGIAGEKQVPPPQGFIITSANKLFVPSCMQRLDRVLSWHIQNKSTKRGEKVFMADPDAYILLESCIEESMPNIGYVNDYERKALSHRLSEYLDLLISLDIRPKKFNTTKTLANLLLLFNLYHQLEPKTTIAHQRIVYLLKCIGEDASKDQAYAVRIFHNYTAFHLANPLYARMLQIPIIQESFWKIFNDCSILDLAPSVYHEDILKKMYSTLPETYFSEVFKWKNLSPINDDNTHQHLLYFINKISFTDKIRVKQALYALRALLESPGKAVNIETYLAHIVYLYIFSGQEHNFPGLMTLLKESVLNAEFSRQPHTLIQWQAVEAKLPAPHVQQLKEFFFGGPWQASNSAF